MAGHDHAHDHVPERLTRSFGIGIGLNLLFVLAEVGVGLSTGSMALLSDAGHNFIDVTSLLLSLLAFRLAKRPSTEVYTYGLRKTTILISLLNALVLLAAVGSIGYESVERLLSGNRSVPGLAVAATARLGVLVNGISAWLFHKDQAHDLNVRGAYLHLLSDALVSLGVVLAGVLMYFTHWYWLDPLLSLGIGLLILLMTWSLLSQSLRLSLDAVPEGIDLQNVKQAILKSPHITSVSHVHLWAISTTQNALTAHLTVAEPFDLQQFEHEKHEINHRLEHLKVHHTTFEVHPHRVQEKC